MPWLTNTTSGISVARPPLVAGCFRSTSPLPTSVRINPSAINWLATSTATGRNPPGLSRRSRISPLGSWARSFCRADRTAGAARPLKPKSLRVAISPSNILLSAVGISIRSRTISRVKGSSSPGRWMVNLTVEPLRPRMRMIASKRLSPSVDCPSMSVTTSPARRPARSAGVDCRGETITNWPSRISITAPMPSKLPDRSSLRSSAWAASTKIV